MGPIELSEAASVSLSILAILIASLFDLKYREVPDKLWALYAPPAIALTAIRLSGLGMAVWPSIASMALTLALSLGLYRLGAFGGADAKAFICLALSMPLNPSMLPSGGNFFHPFFPLTVICNSYLLSLSSIAYMAARNLLWALRNPGRGAFDGLEGEPAWRKAAAVLTGYKMRLGELAAKAHLYYPMEEVILDGGIRRRLRISFSAKEEPGDYFKRLAEILGESEEIWATPGLPLLAFVALGLLIALLHGDISHGLIIAILRAIL
ncbi:MAG: A24 family peptidase C-terminal domain-containing protein [Candidatus Bathyarchaeia archaeon]